MRVGALAPICALATLAVQSTAAAQAADTVRLVAGGDVMFGRVWGPEWTEVGGEAPLEGVRHLLAAADIAVVNLESPLCQDQPDPTPGWQTDGPRLMGHPSAAAHLAAAGIDVVTLANNHVMDCGQAGLRDTIEALRTWHIAAVGADPEGDAEVPVIVQVGGGVRVAVIAVTDRWNRGRPLPEPGQVALMPLTRAAERLPMTIAQARDELNADIVVVALHWGVELADRPSTAQRELAHTLIDAGANVVVGHNSHVMQLVERYRNGTIAYSLGNLLFDMQQPATRFGGLLEVELQRSHDGTWNVGPTVVHWVRLSDGDHRPIPAEGGWGAPAEGGWGAVDGLL